MHFVVDLNSEALSCPDIEDLPKYLEELRKATRIEMHTCITKIKLWFLSLTTAFFKNKELLF